jgi:hypothetical protein
MPVLTELIAELAQVAAAALIALLIYLTLGALYRQLFESTPEDNR